ncbi:Pkinase-domain-containing protein [Favolaschia claudopus]|uniref:non-specific serine/threonine protein kinase n=1 Tax=Favolaschia claudopus TaxID=2862362 RepID=A0AAW0EHS3_9AGAR
MHNSVSIPLPPPDSSPAGEKQPGMTRQDLIEASASASASTSSSSVKTLKPLTPLPPSGPIPAASAPASPTGTAPPPPPSSAPNTPAVPMRAPSRAASIASDVSHGETGGGGKHKFNLKDLLGSGPKLSRRSSARSASSRHSGDGSESEVSYSEKETPATGTGSKKSGGKGGSVKSAGGDSAASLSKKGATSVVRLAHKWDRSEGDKMYAVKEFRKRRKTESEKEYVKKLTAEFCISSTLHHINVVETVDLVQDEQGRWCEVMEFCPGGDLYAAIKKGGMSPSEVECCFKQILSGVGYLHSQGVAHRDIKPENLFFDHAGHLKIGDYGASTVYRLPWEATIHMSTGLCGSEPYIAPEQFLGKPYDARLVDIWACGIVYYCLHFQELPWRAAQPSDQLYAAYAAAAAATPPPPLAAAPSATSSVISNGHGHTNGTTSSASSTSSAPHSPIPTSTNANAASPNPSTTSPHPAPIVVDRDRHQTSSTLVFPPTISNLSPRACRPLIRKMLEPDPKMRASIEEVLGCAWMKGVEVCWEVGDKAKHVHVNARAMAAAVLGDGRDR